MLMRLYCHYLGAFLVSTLMIKARSACRARRFTRKNKRQLIIANDFQMEDMAEAA